MDLLDLEVRIKALAGVLGCVILSDAEGEPAEIQAFIPNGADRTAVRDLIHEEARALDVAGSLKQVLVFELGTEALLGGPDALRQAELLAELEALTQEQTGDDAGPVKTQPGPTAVPAVDRPVLRRVVALSTTWRSEAEVSLGGPRGEVVGQAVGEHSAHGLRVLAQATLDAVHKLIGDEGVFSLLGTSLSDAHGQEVVLAFVGSPDGDLVGAALVRDGPLTEAAVRATLDAVNRRLARSP